MNITTPSADPLVSVVVRTTGRPELRDALDSVAAQTYGSIEVVLVDVEGKAALDVETHCGRFPLRIVSRGQHLGRGAACNLGLDHAKGDFVVFLDDDDWFLPDHVHTLVTAVANSEGARAAYAGVECRRHCDNGSWERLRLYNEPYDATRLLLENYIPIHAVLFARDLLGDCLRFEESFRVYEDWDFWIQLSQLTRFLHVDRVTAIYRISATSGFGVRHDDPEAGPGYARVLEKWRPRWTSDQLISIARYPLLWTERKTNDAQQNIRAHEQTIAALQRRVDELESNAGRHLDMSRGVQLEPPPALLTNAVPSDEPLSNIQANLAARLNAVQSSAVWQLASRPYEIERRYPNVVRYAVVFPKLAWWLLTLKLMNKLRERTEARRVIASGLFDERWYMLQYPDVLIDGFRPIAHWTLRGWREGRNPNPLFLTAWYREKYPEVSVAARDPLLHYITVGATAGYDPNPLFDSSWYLQQYPDVAAQHENPLAHYIRLGWREGRDPHPDFSTREYLEQNPQLTCAGINPLVHALWSLSASK